MSRMLRILTACAVCSVAACGTGDTGDGSKPDDSPKNGTVKIVAFHADADALEQAGQSTTLHFTVDPPTAKLTIDGVGDVTGRLSAQVAPQATTTYRLTAVNGAATATETTVVTVGPAAVVSIDIQPDTTTPIAGTKV